MTQTDQYMKDRLFLLLPLINFICYQFEGNEFDLYNISLGFLPMALSVCIVLVVISYQIGSHYARDCTCALIASGAFSIVQALMISIFIGPGSLDIMKLKYINVVSLVQTVTFSLLMQSECNRVATKCFFVWIPRVIKNAID